MTNEFKLKRIKARKKVRTIKARSLTNPTLHTSMRDVLDRIVSGRAVVNPPVEHNVLPPDGEDDNDFETGTEEILDLVDAQRIQELTEEQLEKYRKDVAEYEEELRNKKYNEDVERAVLARLSKERSDAEITQ